jgi:hypothetical protein
VARYIPVKTIGWTATGVTTDEEKKLILRKHRR